MPPRALRFLIAAPIMFALLAGCSGSGTPDSDPSRPFGPATYDGEFLRVDVAVPVVLFGFPPATVSSVHASLQPETIEQFGYSDGLSFPPGGEGHADATYPLPVLPTAHYQVQAAPPELEAEFFAFAKDADAPNGTMLDGNRVEDWLAANLPTAGFALDPDAPTLVVLHGSAFLQPVHGWRYAYANGYLDQVRVFGERHPLLVADPSASVDPYTGDQGSYTAPIETTDAKAVDALVRDATQYRLLQGAIYPVSLAPCHAITFVLAVRAGALVDTVALREAASYVDGPALDAAFEHLTGPGQVFADVKVLQLPVDDPGLDAFTRGGFNTVDAARWWVTQNWDRYWVPHDGCDAYVSIVILGDSDQGGGIGMYDIDGGRRIAISSDALLSRALGGQDRYTVPGVASFGGPADSIYRYDLPNLFFAHEAGHLIGQRHPHDIDLPDYTVLSAFSSVYSVMSYQTGFRTIDFGAVDHANWWRNRVGFALDAATAAAGEGAPEVQQALRLAEAYDWEAAYWTLQPILPPTAP